MLKTIRDKIWHRTWTQEELDKIVGHQENCYLTYAEDEDVRSQATSGGSTTALLLYLFETGQIDGALVLRTVIENGKARARFFIAQSREEVLSARGSKYSAVYFAQDALPLIRDFDGKLAVVALPCDARILHNTRKKHADIDSKIVCVITLFCGHNSEPEMTDFIIDKINDGYGELVDLTYCVGHWRGEMTATFADGTQIKKPKPYYSDYRNLYFYAQKKCHHCFDHFGYYCDISAGDIWSPEMKNEPIKHTALITRTDFGERLVQQARHDGILHVTDSDVVAIANGQARIAPFHYDVSARALVSRLFFRSEKIKNHTGEKVRWNHFLVAIMALFNERLTRTKRGKQFVKLLPRPVVRGYLYILKGLESI